MLDVDPKMIRLAGRVSAVGIEIVIAIVVGYVMGRWLDGRFKTHPYLTAGFTLCGVGAGVKALVRANREFQRRMQQEDDTDTDE